MIVFKCVTASEITELCKNDGYNETNKMIKFTKYSTLAMLKFKKSPSYGLENSEPNVMFLVAEIPDEILKKYETYSYFETFGLPINHLSCIPVLEYNLPSSLFLKQYIVEFSLNINNYDNSYDFKKYLNLFNEVYNMFGNLKQTTDFLQSNNIDELCEILGQKENKEKKRLLNVSSF